MSPAIKANLEKLKSQIQQLVSRIEESAAFERLMIKYENADPRHQKRMVAGAYVGVILLLVILLTLPILMVISTKNRLSTMRGLTGEVRALNAKGNVVYRPAPPPQGWQGIAAANSEEFEASLSQFMASMGIPPDLALITRQGDTLSFKTTGASLRQLTAILFLFDGWFPGIRVQNMRTSVSKDSRELIDFEFNIEFNPSEAARIAGGRIGGDPSSAISSFMNAPSGTGSRGSGGGGGDFGGGSGGGGLDVPPPPPSGGNDFDYQSNLPPPPPPPPSDFEDYSEPLEPPPDLPPPPPLEGDL